MNFVLVDYTLINLKQFSHITDFKVLVYFIVSREEKIVYYEMFV